MEIGSTGFTSLVHSPLEAHSAATSYASAVSRISRRPTQDAISQQAARHTVPDEAVKVSLSKNSNLKENTTSRTYGKNGSLKGIKRSASIDTQALGKEIAVITGTLDPISKRHAVLKDLDQRDQHVRKHEQTHMNHLGQFAAGDIDYTFTVGPDGFDYAMTGQIAIDMSEADTPEATVEKARTIQQAALAPEDPSGADQLAALRARKMENNALAQLEDNTQPRQDFTTYNGTAKIRNIPPAPTLSVDNSLNIQI